MREKISFSIEGSLIDLNTHQIPNYSRSSPLWLEQVVNNNLQLHPIPSYAPAFYPDDGAWLLEPEGLNLISWNSDLSQPIWLKGSNVVVFPDEVPSPDASYLADRLVFASGIGTTQLLRRPFSLKAGTDYCLSAILQLEEGARAATKDVLRISDATSGSVLASIPLSQLNNFAGRYQILSANFKTSGVQPTLPGYSHDRRFTVLSATPNTVTISTTEPIPTDSLAGGRIQFDLKSIYYQILGNTSQNNSCTIIVDSTRLLSDGVGTNSIAYLHGAPEQPINLEVYVESTLSVNFGGIQLEERDFRSSMIYQEGELNLRAATKLTYRRSPIQELKTFGIFIDFKEWRGDGNVFDMGNLKAYIKNKKFTVTSNNASMTSKNDLPSDAKIFIQVSEANSNISLYINKILEAQTLSIAFVGDPTSGCDFTSLGMRSYNRFVVMDEILLDGSTAINSPASQEVGELFDAAIVIDSVAIAANAPLVILPPVTVAAKPAPLAISRITGVQSASNTIQLIDASDFSVDTSVVVLREDTPTLKTRIITKNGNTVGLETTAGIVIGDTLVFGSLDLPGYASVRFPFTPIDEQTIKSIDAATGRLTVSSTLSFAKTRAFVHTPLYQDIAEVIVTDINNNNSYLFVDSVEGISVGDIISQASDEMQIDPTNYLSGLLTEIDGISIGRKYTNGLVLENRNPRPIQCRPYIRPLGL